MDLPSPLFLSSQRVVPFSFDDSSWTGHPSLFPFPFHTFLTYALFFFSSYSISFFLLTPSTLLTSSHSPSYKTIHDRSSLNTFSRTYSGTYSHHTLFPVHPSYHSVPSHAALSTTTTPQRAGHHTDRQAERQTDTPPFARSAFRFSGVPPFPSFLPISRCSRLIFFLSDHARTNKQEYSVGKEKDEVKEGGVGSQLASEEVLFVFPGTRKQEQ